MTKPTGLDCTWLNRFVVSLLETIKNDLVAINEID